MTAQVLEARDAFARRDWLTAFEGLSAAGDEGLRAADYADLATAAWLLCRHDDCVSAMQRAHQAHRAAGDTAGAVRTAFWLSMVLRQGGERAVANGWIGHAERLAADLPADAVEHGYVEYARLLRDVFGGDLAAAAPRADRVAEVGRRHGDPNLVAAGLMARGRRALAEGRVADGLAALDQAIVCLLSGGLSPIIAGQVLCSCIEGCQEVWELGRVGEWTRALDAWCEEQEGLEMFTGTCALHKGQVAAMRGDFAGAVQEFRESIDRFVRGRAPRGALGLAFVELGEALRVQGRLEEAAGALRQAAEAGWDPVAAQAMLDLSCGRLAEASAAVGRMLAEPRPPLQRAQLLTRVVEVLLTQGDAATAAPVVDELAELAERAGTTLLLAHARRARGALSLATSGEAEPDLRAAVESFVEAGCAYEAARTRLLLADALVALGDERGAELERGIGSRALAEMGAPAPDPALASGGLTGRQVEVLRLVADGCSNREIARQLQLSEKTVARHLSNIFSRLDVPSRTAAAAWAIRHGVVRD